MFTHVDSKLAQVLYIKFDEYMWKRGMFPPAEKNGSILVDPWSQTGLFSTPFDQVSDESSSILLRVVSRPSNCLENEDVEVDIMLSRP